MEKHRTSIIIKAVQNNVTKIDMFRQNDTLNAKEGICKEFQQIGNKTYFDNFNQNNIQRSDYLSAQTDGGAMRLSHKA